MRKLLILDDDEDARFMLRELVEASPTASDLAVFEAATAGEAEALCGQHAFDLYIIDFMLEPGSHISSLEFLTRLYARCIDPAVILCTGYDEDGLPAAYRELLTSGTLRLLPKNDLNAQRLERLLVQLLNRGMSVLVVDDDEDDVEQICLTLRQVPTWHFDIDVALSLDEGLSAMDQRQYDLHIVDYRLGTQMATSLIQRVMQRSRLPAILTSQYATDDLDLELVEPLARGDLLFVPKLAIDQTRLSSTVMRACYQSYDAELER